MRVYFDPRVECAPPATTGLFALLDVCFRALSAMVKFGDQNLGTTALAVSPSGHCTGDPRAQSTKPSFKEVSKLNEPPVDPAPIEPDGVHHTPPLLVVLPPRP